MRDPQIAQQLPKTVRHRAKAVAAEPKGSVVARNLAATDS